MSKTIVKVLSARNDLVADQLQQYLSSEGVAPSQILAMGVFPYGAIMETLPSGFGICLRHLPADNSLTERCVVNYVAEKTLKDFGDSLRSGIDRLEGIVAEEYFSLGAGGHAWIAISKKVD